MQASKEFLKNNNIRSRISFKDGEPRTVTLIKDEPDSFFDEVTKKTVNGVRYSVKEKGEEKTFFTGSIGLIQKLSEFSAGDEVVIQMKRKKGENGYISYFEAKRVGEEDSGEFASDDYIPSIDELNF